jgi:phenylpropionate dioxygenase-like ring-hydroxylating dioxygenase large terminal subunit
MTPGEESAMTVDTWYCAGWSRELADEPLGRQLLGRHLVLFRDADGTAYALGARCPHRGADLARGAVVGGCVQCPFHGWRFDGNGQCVRVPSQPDGVKISTAARVPSFPLRERDGTLWIWMGRGEPSTEPPRVPAESQGRSARRLFLDAEFVEAPFARVLENAFDKAHLPFIH